MPLHPLRILVALAVASPGGLFAQDAPTEESAPSDRVEQEFFRESDQEVPGPGDVRIKVTLEEHFEVYPAAVVWMNYDQTKKIDVQRLVLDDREWLRQIEQPADERPRKRRRSRRRNH